MRVPVCLVFIGEDWSLWCIVSLMFLVRRSSLCQSSGMFGLFGKRSGLWCMVSFRFLVRRLYLCEISVMFGLCR